MVLFHLFYNINYYWPLAWYENPAINRIWQFSIAGSFFVISGITSNFLQANKNIKRGLITSLLGLGISLLTFLAAPDQFILWGVLNGLGAAMILTGLMQKYWDLSYKWMPLFLILFIGSYKVPRGSLLANEFFASLYQKNLFFLGFPAPSFKSTDYFPLIPWFFIFAFGFSLGKYLKKVDFYGSYGTDSPLAKIGRHSIEIYLAHQIILYPLITLIYNFTQ